MDKHIQTFDELTQIERFGNYVLTQDIDCGGASIPNLLGDFSGVLDGNGHTVYNLVLTDRIWGDEQSLALFCSTSKATIKNISFENLTLSYDAGCYSPRVAALVVNCYKTTITGVKVIASNKSAKETPLVYDCNNCNLVNNTMMCNGKPDTIAKYE